MTQSVRPVKWYAYGHDFGNSEISAAVLRPGSASPLKRSIPTAFVQARLNAIKGLGIEMDKKRSLTHQFENETLGYALGDFALSFGTDVWTGRGDEKRYASQYSLRGLLTLSASLIADDEYGLFVVCGIPVSVYQRLPTLKREIKKSLEGTHIFSTDGGKKFRTVHIKVVAVVMEGAGALIAYGGDKMAKGAECGVIDIGGGTTDLYGQRGAVPVPDFCKTKYLAVENALTMFAQSVEEWAMQEWELEVPRPLTAQEIRDCAYAYVYRTRAKAARNKKNPEEVTPYMMSLEEGGEDGEKKSDPLIKRQDYPPVATYGKEVPAPILHNLMGKSLVTVGRDIDSFVHSAWQVVGGPARLSPLLLIGGGFYYFYDVLKQRIPHLTAPDDPIHANALGYAQLAMEALKKDPKVFAVPAATPLDGESNESATTSAAEERPA